MDHFFKTKQKIFLIRTSIELQLIDCYNKRHIFFGNMALKLNNFMDFMMI